MSIGFNSIPSNLLIPFMAVEFDSSKAAQGPAQLNYVGLLIGQMTGQGTATPNTLYKVTSADQVLTYAGRGSQLHLMAKAWFANNQFTEAWIGVLADNSAGVAASGTLTVSGPATAAGTIQGYVAGNLIQVAVASGDSANTIASNLASAIGKHATGTVTCATAIAGNTVTVGSTLFTGASGAATPGAATFSIDTSNNACAASIAAQVNAHAIASKLVVATALSAVVTFRAVVGGTAGEVALTSSGSTLAVSGATLTGDSADTDLPLHASVSSAVVTTYARNKGPTGNDIDMRFNLQPTDRFPAGVSVAVGAMSSGATNPVLTSLIAAMGDRWFQVIAHPYTDATSLSALEAEMLSRAGPMRSIDGACITSAAGTQSTLGTLGTGRNSQFSCIVAQPGKNPLAEPCEFAAAVAAQIAASAANDPAQPFQTLPLVGIVAPDPADLFTNNERNTNAHDGIAGSRSVSGQVVLDAMVTTYQTNAAGTPDTAYQQLNTVLNLLYLRYSFRNRIQTRYPRAKIMDDGQPLPAGQQVLTPSAGAAEAVLWATEMQALGLVEDVDDFKKNVVCQRDLSNPNRLNWLLPPNLVNQFVTGAAQVQFRL